jgi:ATP P2X receptor
MALSYETVKVVSIPDYRLACLRYCLVGAIFVYVGVFELWAFGGWLASSQVHGAVRFSLQQPTEQGCDPFHTTLDSDCRNDFAPVHTLPYCSQSPSSSSYPGNVYPCQIYEAITAQYVTESSLLVVTRASSMNQTLVCGDNLTNIEMSCPHTYEDTSEEEGKFYVAQSDAFTVLLDHAVTVSKTCDSVQKRSSSGSSKSGYSCTAESSDYQGRLLSRSPSLCREQSSLGAAYAHYRGNQQTESAPCYIAPNQTDLRLDFFSLDVLFRAGSDASLDACVEVSTSVANGTQCQTYRDVGATLLLNIVWNDFVVYHGKVEPHYYYQVAIVGRSFKIFIPYYQHYRTRRTLLSAHGIRIAVVLGGEFHQFELLAFLITVTTALGLLAVSTTIVDSLMLYVLPGKERYAKAKYEVTNDISGSRSTALLGAYANSGEDEESEPNETLHSSMNVPLIGNAQNDVG